jgi:hypothetical protein
VDRGEVFSFSNSKDSKQELPSALLQAGVAVMRGVGVSRPLENSTTPKRARAQPPQLILRTHVHGRKPSFDANTFPTTLKGSYTPATEFSVTTRDYRWKTFRTSSWKPIRVEGNFRRPCPEISLKKTNVAKASLSLA